MCVCCHLVADHEAAAWKDVSKGCGNCDVVERRMVKGMEDC